jgi:hypothetical protein
MARLIATDSQGHMLVITTDPGQPISLEIVPAGQVLSASPTLAQEIRTKLSAAIGVAQGDASVAGVNEGTPVQIADGVVELSDPQ